MNVTQHLSNNFRNEGGRDDVIVVAIVKLNLCKPTPGVDTIKIRFRRNGQVRDQVLLRLFSIGRAGQDVTVATFRTVFDGVQSRLAISQI